MSHMYLEKLAGYIETLPPDYEYFGMERYHGYSDSADAPLPAECGAVACAIGHGPAAGIPALFGESWIDYSSRVFFDDPMDDAWIWCFSDAWEAIDPTPSDSMGEG